MPALSDDDPRITIRSPLPKLPEPVEVVTPATRPLSSCVGLATYRMFDSFICTLLMALVTSERRWVP